MEYLKKTFSVYLTGNSNYEKNYNAIFKKSFKQKLVEKINRWLENTFLKGE